MNANIKPTRRSRKDFPPSVPFSELPLSGANTEDEAGVSSPPHSTPQPSPKSGEAYAARETGLAADSSSPAPGADVAPNSVVTSLPPETSLSAGVKSDLAAAEPEPESPVRTALAVVSAQVDAIQAMDIRVAELESRYAGVIFQVETTAGMADAKRAREEIREVRYALQNMLRDGKVPLNNLKRHMEDTTTARIDRLLGVETPVDSQIKGEEQRKADEKRQREEAEQRRKDAIEARIEEIRNRASEAMGKPSADIAALIEQTTAIAIDDAFAEFKSKAESVQKMTLDKLRYFHQAAVAAEEKARELAEQEARLRADREAQRLRERRMEAISDINGLIVVAARGRTLAAYDAAIQQLERRDITAEEFGDLVDTAAAARANTLEAVKRDRAAIAAQLEQEAETKRKRDADEADRIRKDALRDRIEAIRAFADGTDVAPAIRTGEMLAQARAFKIDSSFEEMQTEAQKVLDETIARLVDIHSARIAAEAETARLAEQKREQDRQAKEAEETRKLRDKRIGNINFIRGIVGMSESLATVGEFDTAIADTAALVTSIEEYGDLASEATAARDSTLDILRARRQILADRLELQAAAAVSRETVAQPTDPAEATDGELLSPAALFTNAGAVLPPEPDAPSVDDAILTTLDALALAYNLDDVRGKELIVRMGMRVTELAA